MADSSNTRLDARIEAACEYFYDVYGDDELERMRGVLEAADEAERPAVERLVAALRALVEMDQPPHGFPDSECPICDARSKARALLAEFGQQPTDKGERNV